MKLTNKLIVFIDYFVKHILLSLLSGRKREHGVGTGRVVAENLKPEVLYHQDDVMYVFHPYTTAHSLWRSQEYSLIYKHKSKLEHPIFDLGCGDGSFSKILFDKIEYGVDPDKEALESAKLLGLYSHLLNVPAENTGLVDESIASVVSNSVLEHTQNLDDIIKEMSRILKKNGKFMFTVPNDQLSVHLSELFGQKESERMNGPLLFSHHNLLTNDEWILILEKHGFKVDFIQNYQSIELIEKYRRLGFFLSRIIEKLLKQKPKGKELVNYVTLVKKSLQGNQGNCTFIIASK